MINILFTSVGRRVELLRAFRQAYQTLQLTGNIVAIDIDPLAPALQVAHQRYIVPRLTSVDYIPSLVKICQQEQIAMIFPLIDPDIPILARHCTEIEATGARLAVVSVKAAELTADKWLTTQFFQDLNLPVPKSWLPDHLDLSNLTYPLFIKPRRGSAAKSTYKINNRQELLFFLDYVPNPIIQEYLPGPEITNDIVCDLDGKLLGVVSRQRIETRWGEVAKGVTVFSPTIKAACAAIANALPAKGPITAQCIMKENVPHFTEINARFGGGIPLGIAAGFDSPRLLLAHASGQTLDLQNFESYKTGLYMTRFDDSYFLTDTDYAQMASYHL